MTVDMRVSRWVVALAAVAGFPGQARAEGAAAERERFLSELPPLPRPNGPAPLAEADEHARLPWELIPRVGVGTSVCYGAVGPLCSAQGEGLSLGGTALWRLTPHVSLGLAYARVGGPLDPAGLAPGASASVASDFIGIVARGYFLDRGAWDPYVQAAFGRGSYRLDLAGGGADGQITAAAPASEVAAGIDFWIGSFAKLGPSVEYLWTWLGDARTCAAATGCTLVRAGELGVPTTHIVLGLSLTAAFGRAM